MSVRLGLALAVIGLSVTAAGATAAGIGAGTTGAVVSHCIANHFEECEEAFKELNRRFAILERLACHMDHNVSLVHQALTEIAVIVDDVEHCARRHRSSLTYSIDRLCERFNDFHNGASSCRQMLQSKERQLKPYILYNRLLHVCGV